MADHLMMKDILKCLYGHWHGRDGYHKRRSFSYDDLLNALVGQDDFQLRSRFHDSLKDLVELELIRKVDNGKIVFYRLTTKGKMKAHDEYYDIDPAAEEREIQQKQLETAERSNIIGIVSALIALVGLLVGVFAYRSSEPSQNTNLKSGNIIKVEAQSIKVFADSYSASKVVCNMSKGTLLRLFADPKNRDGVLWLPVEDKMTSCFGWITEKSEDGRTNVVGDNR